MEERVQGLRESVAGVSHRVQSPKIWLGSNSINVLQVLCDTLDLVEQLAIQLASHTHNTSQIPAQADIFLTDAAKAKILLARLSSVTL